jgi:hypothetical protein
VSKHGFGHFEVGNDTVPQGADRDNISRSSSEHSFGVVTNGKDLIGSCFHSDDRGLTEDNPVISGIYEGIGGAEIDSDIVRHQAEKSCKH